MKEVVLHLARAIAIHNTDPRRWREQINALPPAAREPCRKYLAREQALIRAERGRKAGQARK